MHFRRIDCKPDNMNNPQGCLVNNLMIISPSLPNRIDEAHPRQTLELACPSFVNFPKDKSDGGPIVLSTCKEVLLEMEGVNALDT